MDTPWQYSAIPAEDNATALRDERAKLRGYRTRCSGRGMLWAIVEVTVAIVIETYRDVVMLVARRVEGAAELQLHRERYAEVTECLPRSLVASTSEFTCVRTRILRCEERVVVGIVDLVDMNGSSENWMRFSFWFSNPKNSKSSLP